ncbi:MAG TPA: ABC transporter ATP-binding protein [Phycisphaerales bacterium]
MSNPTQAGHEAPTLKPVLTVRDLAVSFDNRGGPRLRAVDSVSVTMYPGQTLAVVGESGCGKSVTALTMMRLIPSPPSRVDRGSIVLAGEDERPDRDLVTLDERALRAIRGREIAMIFQEPMTSLNPVFTVGEQITEAIRLHQSATRAQAREIAIAAMDEVGITSPRQRLDQYPHQFSGGMRQRVMIAMALACKPRVLLADEPTTALDVTIQAQILDLITSLRASHRLSVMLITHDMGVVAQAADVVCVMYAGRVVEYARVDAIFATPRHPYTRALLACIPRPGSRASRLATIREVMDDRGAMRVETAGGSATAWWPWHDAPAGVTGSQELGTDYALVEANPGHWVGVWRSEGVTPGRSPDLDWTVARNATRIAG